MHTFTYQKTLLHTFYCLFLKSSKAFSATLKNIKLNALAVYDDRYIKNKIITYGDEVYTIFQCLNVPEDDIEYEFTVISIDSLLAYKNKYYLQFR